MKLVYVVLALLFSTQAWAQAPRINGTWAPDLESCLQQDSDSGLTVSERKFQFWESLCTHNGLRRVGQTNTYRVRMSCEGEGEKWAYDASITVQPDAMTIASKEGTTTYMRCPVPRKVAPKWREISGLWTENRTCGVNAVTWHFTPTNTNHRHLSCLNTEILPTAQNPHAWHVMLQCLDSDTNKIVDITGKIEQRTDRWVTIDLYEYRGGSSYDFQKNVHLCEGPK